ncbi:hypothetical protein APT58_02685 [Corynebacterium glutamicum]|nr:hypothetical protein APT58_02685 [Corynebacterium glutamicum]
MVMMQISSMQVMFLNGALDCDMDHVTECLQCTSNTFSACFNTQHALKKYLQVYRYYRSHLLLYWREGVPTFAGKSGGFNKAQWQYEARENENQTR